MLGRLALLFVVVPLVELFLLIRLGQWVGLLPTLGIVVVTGFLGALLARREGWRAFRRFGAAVARGEVPTDAALDGVSVLIGGAFLPTPGVLTDLVGFGLLLPPVRSLFKSPVLGAIRATVTTGALQFWFYGPAGSGMWRTPQDPAATGSAGGPGDQLTESGPPSRPGEIVVPPPETHES